MGNDWLLVRQQAMKNIDYNGQWNSFVFGKRYSVLEVCEDKLIIRKIDGGRNVVLTAKLVKRACDVLREKKSCSNHKLVRDSVAQEAALVFLHPMIVWNSNDKTIHWVENKQSSSTQLNEIIKEAPDDEIEKIWRLIQQRRNQNKFKKNISKIYNNTCCVTGVNVEEVLEAAHIYSYSKSGNNNSKNGLLLRSDIHQLFDCGLIEINFSTLKIKVADKLKNSIYYVYNDCQIKLRIDGAFPGEENLRFKNKSNLA